MKIFCTCFGIFLYIFHYQLEVRAIKSPAGPICTFGITDFNIKTEAGDIGFLPHIRIVHVSANDVPNYISLLLLINNKDLKLVGLLCMLFNNLQGIKIENTYKCEKMEYLKFYDDTYGTNALN